MRGFPALPAAEAHRVRRWDAIVLGGALPGLVAAVRIAKAGHRVLLLEEARAGDEPEGRREPFFLCDAGPEGVLGSCLRALGIPLIDQKRMAPMDTGLQVILREARIDVGRPAETQAELAAWGIARADRSQPLFHGLAQAAAERRRVLLESPLVVPRRRPGIRERLARRPRTHEPASPIAELPPELERVVSALVLGLARDVDVPPQIALRLLDGAFGGRVGVAGGGGLRGILARRLEALHVERRSLPGPLRLCSVAGQPAIDPTHVDEVWSGRALVLNAPRCAIADAVDGRVPSPLRAAAATWRTVSVRLRGPREALPRRMADRLLTAPTPEADTTAGPSRIRVLPGRRPDEADVIASRCVPADSDASGVEAELERTLRDLIPFSRNHLERRALPSCVWDTDDLQDAPRGRPQWPPTCELRIATKPVVYALDRGDVAPLHSEGDLLLGWRGGDAIAAGLD
jgi:hypothetical protein